MIYKFLFLILFPLISFSQIKFDPLFNHTEEEKEIVSISQDLSNELVQSKCFEKFMVNRDLRKTNGKSNLEVVEHLKNAKLSVPVHMYYKKYSRSVGYRVPPKPDIYTNRKFHSGATACSRASNLTHEWSHPLGYDHSYKPNLNRPYSVPYSINAAFSSCCACNGIRDCIILENPVEKKTKKVCYRNWKTIWITKKCYNINI